jgi:DUF4097 and DUF4098 domain-containing protein YvlB
MGRPILALGGIALIGAGVALTFGFFADSTASAAGLVSTAVHSVRIDQNSGSVQIRVGDVQGATINQTFHYSFGKPDNAYKLSGDQLVLSDCGWNCRVDYVVVVPVGTMVTGESSSGDISLNGVASADVSASSGSVDVRNVAGAVTVKASSGDITLDSIAKDVKVKASSGNITGSGLGGKVDAESSSGQLKLTLTDIGDVRAVAHSGDIDVTVPKATYRVLGNSDSGNRTIGVTQDPSATHVLQLDSSSGDVDVHAA